MPQSETREKAGEWMTYFDPIQDGKAFSKTRKKNLQTRQKQYQHNLLNY